MNSQLHNQNKPFAGATLRKDTVDKPLADGYLIMETQLEIWKDVIGYEGLYKVSNFGRVKSLERYVLIKGGGTRVIIERIMAENKVARGYIAVGLSKNGSMRKKLVHRMVLAVFVGESSLCVDHINGEKGDNKLVNLRYCTYRENSEYYFKNRPNKKNKHTGVTKYKNRWQARIYIYGGNFRIGSFRTEHEAYTAYMTVLGNKDSRHDFECSIAKYRNRNKCK